MLGFEPAPCAYPPTNNLRRPPSRAAVAIVGLAPLTLLLGLGLTIDTPWRSMWALLLGTLLGFKWLTWCLAVASGVRPSMTRSLGYIVLWPGMDAERFLTSRGTVVRPGLHEWSAAALKTVLGSVILWGGARLVHPPYSIPAGLVGVTGLAFLILFGCFHLLSLFWRSLGIEAGRIFISPVLAISVGDFWGSRWNMAFRRLAYDLIFRPVSRRCGVRAASLCVFLFSGLIHELIISVPARAGYGLPTAYFLIQAIALEIERSQLGRSLRSGLAGRIFTALVTVGPVCLLIHPPFINQVMLPFMQSVRAL